MTQRMGYYATLQWLIRNDDCMWLYDYKPHSNDPMERCSPAVTAMLAADIFGKDIETFTAALYKRWTASE